MYVCVCVSGVCVICTSRNFFTASFLLLFTHCASLLCGQVNYTLKGHYISYSGTFSFPFQWHLLMASYSCGLQLLQLLFLLFSLSFLLSLTYSLSMSSEERKRKTNSSAFTGTSKPHKLHSCD